MAENGRRVKDFEVFLTILFYLNKRILNRKSIGLDAGLGISYSIDMQDFGFVRCGLVPPKNKMGNNQAR